MSFFQTKTIKNVIRQLLMREGQHVHSNCIEYCEERGRCAFISLDYSFAAIFILQLVPGLILFSFIIVNSYPWRRMSYFILENEKHFNRINFNTMYDDNYNPVQNPNVSHFRLWLLEIQFWMAFKNIYFLLTGYPEVSGLPFYVQINNEKN